ncbi:MAG: patatin-like phospholipase family protein [Rhizobiaceae bacterium]
MTSPTVAIAFGGGGARGLAHIHVIKALEDLGITPVAVAGTSIGSIIGAGLAAGMTSQEMSNYAVDTFSDTGEVLSRFWSMRPEKIGDVFGFSSRTFGSIDPVKALRAFVPEQIPGTFDELNIPMSAVATDFYGQGGVVFDQGDLFEALAASSALPAVFKPVTRNGTTLVDGGIVNSVPYELLFGKADIVIAVDVVGRPKRSKGNIPTRIEALSGASQLMMQATTRLKLEMKPPDVYIAPNVEGIVVLDFLRVRSILSDTSGTVEQAKQAIEKALG